MHEHKDNVEYARSPMWNREIFLRDQLYIISGGKRLSRCSSAFGGGRR